MKKKVLLLSAITALTLGAVSATIATFAYGDTEFTRADTLNNYWNHYAAVEPTLLRHGSKEFWADCSTHTFSLTEPIGATIKEGVPFDTTPYFDDLEEDDPRYVARIDLDIKAMLLDLLGALTHDPYSYVPESMRPEGVQKYSASSLEYDFENNFVDVSFIKYGGFGEQWHMVIENIKESQRFYNVTTYGSAIIGAANSVLMSFLDDNENPVVSWSHNDTDYSALFEYDSGVMDYTIKFVTGIEVPLFGTITPQLDMNYVVSTRTKTVRFQLGEGNALKFVITPNTYTFALEYGIEQISRKAYFSLEKDEVENVDGHIYEFVQVKDKYLVASCADFYIGEIYTSVVGNKARAITGFAGYINELYRTDSGKLLGYKVRETFTKWGFEKTYNTLWFNLNNISNINSVKSISNGSVDPHENNHDVYLNGNSKKFTPTKNKVTILSTSRRYDVEMRKQYFYDIDVAEYETDIPMMFIQDDGTESGETNYSTFEEDILKDNGIAASVALSNTYLNKIRADYLTLIDVFIENKDIVTSDIIVSYIGGPRVI